MESYEVNKDTVALVPKGESKTIVYELDDSFIVDESPLQIMEESCEYFGSSFDGRVIGTSKLVGYTHKVPIIVEESKDLIFGHSNCLLNKSTLSQETFCGFEFQLFLC